MGTSGGFEFIKMSDYPDVIKKVDNIEQFMKDYKEELRWAVKYLMRHQGLAIALPQIGVDYNCCVIRFPHEIKLMFNLDLFNDGDFKKKYRKVKLSDFTIENASIPFVVPFYKKFIYSYIDEHGKEQAKVERIPKKPNKMNVPISVVISNMFLHLQSGFNERINSILNRNFNNDFRNLQAKMEKENKETDEVVNESNNEEISTAVADDVKVETKE